MIYLEVAVAAPLFSTLTYLLKDEEEDAKLGRPSHYIGRQVLVPLGRRIVTGYILGDTEAVQGQYVVKEIREMVGNKPFFPPNMVPFFRWVAQYYQYPIGEVISIGLPAGIKRASRRILRVSSDAIIDRDALFAAQKAIPSWFDELLVKKKFSPGQTRKLLADPHQRATISHLEYSGIVELAESISTLHTKEKTETCYSSNDHMDNFRLSHLSAGAGFDQFSRDIALKTHKKLKLSEIKALYFFTSLAEAGGQPVPRREILKTYKNAGKALEQLCSYGLLRKEQRRIYRNPLGEIPSQDSLPLTLSDEQAAALAQIQHNLSIEQFSCFLLHGITGSGKTEVYLQAAAAARKKNMDVLVLVPEIALASQLEAHFLAHFGDSIALLHSGLSRGERYDQWTLAAAGQVNIVIGARSAVFAPLKNVGLIIVDEEHDSGFKQDDSLKYNGRDLAVLRAKLQKCTVILGSATPSITSYYNAVNKKYSLLTMNQRIGGATLPEVRIIDLNRQEKGKKKSVFHKDFVAELQQNLKARQQSLVLLNRRGFSASYICQDCGTAIQCNHCKVTLSYHKNRNTLVCHYCGYCVSSKLICDNCRSEKLVPMGIGTERVEEELRELFPDAVIERLDSDTAYDRKKFISILKAMKQRQIDILVGTQMIAKGHHFPYVSFVGVVWADGGLNMPDFRAAERTYQLLSQVTGRAGRGTIAGRVIIQTMRPRHYAITFAQKHHYDLFYEKELAIRKHPLFPPYIRLACYRISGEIEYEVRKTAHNLAEACRSFGGAKQFSLDVLGPAPAPLEKIKDRYRWQVLLKSAQTSVFTELGRYIDSNQRKILVGQARISIDIDPENMM